MNHPSNVPAELPPRLSSAAGAAEHCTIDDVPAPFCLIGYDGRFQRMNALWSELLGHPQQSMVGRSFARFVHPDDAQLLVRQLCDPDGDAPPEAFEARFRCGDGSFKWLYCQTRTLATQRAFAIIAMETSERHEAERIARRRATIASLRADIWAAFGGGTSSDQILEVWTELIQRHLDVPDVQIWTRPLASSELVLQARTAATSDRSLDPTLFEPEVRQVGENDVPLVIADVACDPRVAGRAKALPEGAVRGLILHPVRTVDHVIAVLALFFAKACGSLEQALVETIALEIGNVLTRLIREEELLESRRERDRLLDTAVVGFCRIDVNQHVVVWSEGAERLLRWKAADVLGQSLPIATEQSHAVLEACLGGALNGRATEKVETKLLTQDGRLIDVALSAVPLFDSTGGVYGAWLTICDQQERKRSERFLDVQKRITNVIAESRTADEARRALLSVLGTGFGWEVGEYWAQDSTGAVWRRIACWHSSAANAKEFDRASQEDDEEESIAEVARQILDGKLARCFSAAAAFSGATNGLARVELAARCGLQDLIGIPIGIDEADRGVLLFLAMEIGEAENALAGFLGMIAEQFGQFLQFERMKFSLSDARQDLLQATKMDTVGRLVGGVAHDFNNLLTIILGYGEIVLEDTPTDGPNRDLIGEILRAGKRAAGLTRQLLGFCRKESAEPVAVDVNAHIVDMQKMIGRLIGEHIVLSTELSPSLGRVNADPAHIEQVIMNLVVNARDAMPRGGQLAIRTQSVEPGDAELSKFPRVPPGRYVLLSVSDSGSGMDEATRRRIFEPFFTTKGTGKGVGMGLSTVSEIVAEYGGRIEVDSAPKKGTTFRILLPALAPGLAPWQVDAAPDVVPHGDETILLVEDDDRVRQLITRGLTAQGYRVFAAGEPLQAIELSRQHSAEIDLLIADVMLPAIRGPELALRVTALKPSIGVLYISGYGEEEVRRSDLLKNGAAYLQKPFSTHDLARKVREVCDRTAKR
jgi:PAS domain S-box-containing protein